MGQVIEKLKTRLRLAFGRCQFVGQDMFGNQYFEQARSGENPRRWTLYNGVAEASKTPPMWHAWIHHTIKDAPLLIEEYTWQKEHLPNLSGTKLAYRPLCGIKKGAAMCGYERWAPKE